MHRLFSTRHRLFSTRHTLGLKSRGTQSESILHSTLSSPSLHMTFQSVGKKNFNVHSTHYTQFKTSTSAGIIFETIWLILIGSIWFHMSQNIWTILTHQSKCQQKQFLMRLYPSTHDTSWHTKKLKKVFSVSNSEHRRGKTVKAKRKSEGSFD